MGGGCRWHPIGPMNPAYKGGPISDRALVRELYLSKKLSIRQVAKHCGCALRTAARWLVSHGIKTRSDVEGKLLHPLRGPEHPNWKGGPILCVCGNSKGFYSKTCAVCRKRRVRGDGNPNYKGVADIMKLVRQWAHDHWRPLVMKRDGYRCVECGDARGGNLHAHHRVPFYRIVHEAIRRMEVDAKTMNPSERIALAQKLIKLPAIKSIRNGVTLCERCHERKHTGRRTLPGKMWKGAYRSA